ncbi:MAG: purine-nucleoside phosphorylase [Ignavibacteria bacterium]
MPVNLRIKYKDIINRVQAEFSFTPELTLILGSGLGGFARTVNTIKTIKTRVIEGYPVSTVAGHEGEIHFAEYKGKKLLLFQGRVHFYEGFHIAQCILPVLLSHSLGCKNLLLTNAAGGVHPNLLPGALMLNTSFNPMNIKKEISGLIEILPQGERDIFSDFPSDGFQNLIRESAIDEQIQLFEGQYWHTKGPGYETPAEIKMIRAFGGDAVGMSTAHEAVYANSLGIRTSAISCITNLATGISQKKLSHKEVTDTADQASPAFERLIKRIIEMI